VVDGEEVMSIRYFGFCVSLVTLAFPAVALAHHDAAEQSQGHVQIVSKLGVDIEFASFQLGGLKGEYLQLAPKGTYALTPAVELGLRVPVNLLWVRLRDLQSGLGDLDAEAKAQFFKNETWMLSGGFGAEFPTGDASRSLGSGHTEFAPFVSAMTDLHGVTLHSSFSALFALGHPATEEPTLIGPHADRELQYHVGALVPVDEDLTGNLVLGGATALFSDEPEVSGSTFYLHPEAIVKSGKQANLAFGFYVPFGGHLRYDVKISASAVWRL
jgi:hypothetical protein